jgi:hypothetical protein
MRSTLDYLAAIDEQNLIGMNDGGQPVRNHENGSPLKQAIHGFLHQTLGFGIER